MGALFESDRWRVFVCVCVNVRLFLFKRKLAFWFHVSFCYSACLDLTTQRPVPASSNGVKLRSQRTRLWAIII